MLTVVDDFNNTVRDLRDLVKRVGGKLETSLETVPKFERQLDRTNSYIPWLIAMFGFLGIAIILHGTKSLQR